MLQGKLLFEITISPCFRRRTPQGAQGGVAESSPGKVGEGTILVGVTRHASDEHHPTDELGMVKEDQVWRKQQGGSQTDEEEDERAEPSGDDPGKDTKRMSEPESTTTEKADAIGGGKSGTGGCDPTSNDYPRHRLNGGGEHDERLRVEQVEGKPKDAIEVSTMGRALADSNGTTDEIDGDEPRGVGTQGGAQEPECTGGSAEHGELLDGKNEYPRFSIESITEAAIRLNTRGEHEDDTDVAEELMAKNDASVREPDIPQDIEDGGGGASLQRAVQTRPENMTKPSIAPGSRWEYQQSADPTGILLGNGSVEIRALRQTDPPTEGIEITEASHDSVTSMHPEEEGPARPAMMVIMARGQGHENDGPDATSKNDYSEARPLNEPCPLHNSWDREEVPQDLPGIDYVGLDAETSTNGLRDVSRQESPNTGGAPRLALLPNEREHSAQILGQGELDPIPRDTCEMSVQGCLQCPADEAQLPDGDGSGAKVTDCHGLPSKDVAEEILMSASALDPLRPALPQEYSADENICNAHETGARKRLEHQQATLLRREDQLAFGIMAKSSDSDTHKVLPTYFEESGGAPAIESAVRGPKDAPGELDFEVGKQYPTSSLVDDLRPNVTGQGRPPVSQEGSLHNLSGDVSEMPANDMTQPFDGHTIQHDCAPGAGVDGSQRVENLQRLAEAGGMTQIRHDEVACCSKGVEMSMTRSVVVGDGSALDEVGDAWEEEHQETGQPDELQLPAERVANLRSLVGEAGEAGEAGEEGRGVGKMVASKNSGVLTPKKRAPETSLVATRSIPTNKNQCPLQWS